MGVLLPLRDDDAVSPEVTVASLYMAHRLRLVRLAVLLVDDTETAEDVVQDVFARMQRSFRLDDTDKALLKVVHETVKKVTEDIAKLSFNTAISQMMICTNAFTQAEVVLVAVDEQGRPLASDDRGAGGDGAGARLVEDASRVATRRVRTTSRDRRARTRCRPDAPRAGPPRRG